MTFKELFKLSLKGYVGIAIPLVLVSSIVLLLKDDAVEFNNENIYGIAAVLLLILFTGLNVIIMALLNGFITYVGNNFYNYLFRRFEK